MDEFDPEAWTDLFVMVGGASAALAGLLFVAVSINLEQVLQNKALPATAYRALAVLLSLVVLSVLVLVPGQPERRLGLEITLLGALLVVGSVVSVVRGHILPRVPWRWTGQALALALVASVPMLVAGIGLLTERGWGLGWTVVEVVLGLATSMNAGWAILIEIRR